MANKRTIKSITIEKFILEYLYVKSDDQFTILDLINNISSLKQFKYLNRTIWTILKGLCEEEIIDKVGKKRDQADLYKIVNIVTLESRLKLLKEQPILTRTKIVIKSEPTRLSLSSVEVGKNVIEYVNYLEHLNNKAADEIKLLKTQLKILEERLNKYEKSPKPLKIQAGKKIFI